MHACAPHAPASQSCYILLSGEETKRVEATRPTDAQMRLATRLTDGLMRVTKKQTNETDRYISDLMDIFCAVGTVEQTEQPNYLAEGQTPL
eukprot:1154027-Pelagomonas_calceolata.AAC.2